jgi:N-dimethylarginine dimethylaminohydrolase
MASPVFLMSPPRSDWTLKGRANFLSQTQGKVADPRQARADWLAVADGIEAAGGAVLVLPPDPDENLTGMPYVAEAGMLGADDDGPVFVLPNVKPPHRRGEAARIAAFVSALGVRTRAPTALWEGQGDALRVDADRVVHTAGEGPAARSEPAAYDEVHRFFSAKSILLRYRAEPWFHGNTFLGFYRGRGRLVALCCTAALLPGEEAKLRAFVEDAELVVVDPAASKAYATNALQVNDTVLAPAGLPSSVHDVWRGLGLAVVELGLPALFSTGGGAAVCLTNRLDGLTSDDVPRQHLYATTRDAWTLA